VCVWRVALVLWRMESGRGVYRGGGGRVRVRVCGWVWVCVYRVGVGVCVVCVRPSDEVSIRAR
jgi:hypothetical protein